MSALPKAESRRYLIVSDDATVPFAQKVLGKVYQVLTLEQAKNNEQRFNAHVLCWPSPIIAQTHRMRDFAIGLVDDAAEVKLVDTAEKSMSLITLEFIATCDPIWDIQLISDYLNGRSDDVNRIQLLTSEISYTSPTDSGEPSPAMPSESQAPVPPPDMQPSPALPDDSEAFGEIPLDVYADDGNVEYVTPLWVHQPENPSGDWPEPRDLASKLYEGAPFNPDWLPAPLAAFAADIAGRMGGDCGAPAMGAIAACGGLADDGFYTTPKLHDTGWKERACVWTLAVGLSASKKTWLLESALRPVMKMDAFITKGYLERLDQWNFEMEGYADKRKTASKNGEAKPEAPEKPPNEHLLLNEFTIEAIREALMDSPRGMIVYRDEFAGLIKDLDRYSAKASGDRFSILELHNGGTKKIGRVGNFKTVPNWSGILTGCLTPASLKSIMGDLQEDGLLQRFMICMVKPAGQDQDRPPDARAEAAYLRVLNELRNMHAGEHNQHIKFSHDAYDCRMEFMETANALAAADGIPGAMAAHIRKWEASFPRLCLLFHLIDLAVKGQHPGANEVISRSTAEKVRDLLSWQHSHIEEFWLETLGDGGTSFAQVIAKYILAHNPGTLLHNKHVAEPHYNRIKSLTTKELQAAYMTLENGGWLMRDTTGRINSAGVWSKHKVNPAVQEKFKVQADEERKRRAEFREKELARRAANREPGED